MTVEACREWRESLGAYVLGQLPADEQAATRAHVEGCAACRAEVESLAPVAQLLPLADPQHLGAAPAPPAELGDRIASTISRESHRQARVRRRRRFSLGFGFAAATATAAVLAAVLLIGGSGGTEDTQTVAFHQLPRGVAITATMQPRPFGTQIRMDVSGIRSGTMCRVFLRRADGSRVSAGSFRYRYGAGREAVLSSGLDLSAARAVGVRAGDRTFVAPLRHGVGAEASNPTTTQKENS